MSVYYRKQGLYDPQYEHDNCGVGFVVNIKGCRSHQIVKQGLEVLSRLAHRGAVGADPKTGDGAGIMLQVPYEFFNEVASAEGIKLPKPGGYGSGLVFFPQLEGEHLRCKQLFESEIRRAGQLLLGWRKVPVDQTAIGESARASQPLIEQVFIAKGHKVNTPQDFEKVLYNIRREVEKKVAGLKLVQQNFFYINSLSARTFIYKGLLTPDQVDKFYLDLRDPRLSSALALVHSRYSTNTFPTWDLAQPFRFLAHNGEINTLRGNLNWLAARGIDVVLPGGSDSAALDNIFELLLLSGRPLPQVMMMLVPQAWEHNREIPKPLQDFYQYHATFMEPWDGPAAIAFTDGTRVGAVLDRNGLRPARYIITNQDMVVMASEVGVLAIDPATIVHSGRLEPGKLFYIDTEQGRIINDDEIKAKLAALQPYGQWLGLNLTRLEDLPPAKTPLPLEGELLRLLKAFGYSREDLKMIVKPMAEEGKEPIGSMGNDTPLAILSKKPQLLYSYFKQLFAQVTNPPIDPIREELVMSLESYLGPQGNILEERPEHCRVIQLKEPILTDEELMKLKAIRKNGFAVKELSLLFSPVAGKMRPALDKLCLAAEEAVAGGVNLLILSDRGFGEEQVPLPALLALGAVHQHLIRRALRTKTSLILESAEPREVHHFALLFGYGVDAVNPYLAYEAVKMLVKEKELVIDSRTAINNYRTAVNHGLLKILSKMGISTLRSYRGAQIFEALGLAEELVQQAFTGTAARIGGAGFAEIEAETLLRHRSAFAATEHLLPSGGVYQWKKDGETHLWNPESIAALQDAARRGDYSRYREFAALINDQSSCPTTLRSLLDFQGGKAIPLAEVEPLDNIFKRFATGAMSFGSISRGAHEALAIALNRLGGRSNTGEGGEDPARFTPLPNGDSKRSAIKQVASGRFGVNTNYLVNADELQIKVAQGAKPGEGGQLPGHKVSAIIAKTRYTTPGVTLISPPPHHDIYSIEDLAQLIFDLKNVNPAARISVKLVSEVGVGTVAAGVAKGHADMILISGGDGGTGASPLSSIRHAGLPWELGLAETHQTLVLNDLRSRVRLQTDGQLRTGRDVAIAALLGAEEYGFATAALIVLGCVMLRHCHLNNCSLGVATQDEILSRRFSGRPEYIVNYLTFVAQELREIMAQLGLRTIDEMIGRTDLLRLNQEKLPAKAEGLDLSRILFRPKVAPMVGRFCCRSQDHGIDQVKDRELIKLCSAAIEEARPVRAELAINNADRTVGAMLSGAVCRAQGEKGLPDGTIHLKFKGVAGQSFGAWLVNGITFELEGLANDYVGKGISGGRLVIYPDRRATYRPEENIIIGNTTFYGAIAGEAYIRGRAGERFAIRNSGLYAVVEGVGDHGCEYMTGGRVVVLGETGRNFAAGMSGGIAYVYDQEGLFPDRCNQEMVNLEKLEREDERQLQELLHNHQRYTGSELARLILEDFPRAKQRFIKVMPLEYKRVLQDRAMKEEELVALGVSDG